MDSFIIAMYQGSKEFSMLPSYLWNGILMFPYAYFWVFINIIEVARKGLFSLASKDSWTTYCVPKSMLGTVGGG